MEQIIIAEKKNGSGFYNKAFTCNGLSDFINRIRETQLQRRSDEALVETVEQAIAYNNETFGVTTCVISRTEFDSLTADSWDTVVLEKAGELGWYSYDEGAE